jgi:hypothetical protein
MAKARIPKNLSVAELNKLQPGHGTTAQRSRIQRLLANPGTRHLLADRFLSPAQQQTRKTIAFNRTPVVPGSTVTNKDLASQRDAAAALKYGGAETQAGRDIASRQAAVGQTGGYFDNYLAELRAHEANQAQINAQSQAATQGLAGSIQGLGQSDAGVVSQGNQSLQAATGAAPASVKLAAAALTVNAAAKQATTPEAKEAAKFGRSLHDWRMLGPHGRQAVKDAQAKKDAANKRAAKGPKSPDVITSGAFAGYTKDQVAKLPQSEKNRLGAASARPSPGGGEDPAVREDPRPDLAHRRARRGV